MLNTKNPVRPFADLERLDELEKRYTGTLRIRGLNHLPGVLSDRPGSVLHSLRVYDRMNRIMNPPWARSFF